MKLERQLWNARVSDIEQSLSYTRCMYLDGNIDAEDAVDDMACMLSQHGPRFLLLIKGILQAEEYWEGPPEHVLKLAALRLIGQEDSREAIAAAL